MMKKMKIRAAAAALAAAGLIGFTANGAFAFYVSKSCAASSTEKMVVTNYSKGSGQEYHWATYNSSAYQYAIVSKDGKYLTYNLPRVREGYVYVASATSSSTFSATWWPSGSGGGNRSCSVYL